MMISGAFEPRGRDQENWSSVNQCYGMWAAPRKASFPPGISITCPGVTSLKDSPASFF